MHRACLGQLHVALCAVQLSVSEAAVFACAKLPSLLLTAASIWFWHLLGRGPPLWTAGGSLLKAGVVLLLPGGSQRCLSVTGCNIHLPTTAGKRVLAHAYKICNPLYPGKRFFPGKVCCVAQPLMLSDVHAGC